MCTKVHKCIIHADFDNLILACLVVGSRKVEDIPVVYQSYIKPFGVGYICRCMIVENLRVNNNNRRSELGFDNL